MSRIYLVVGHGERDDGSHDPGATGEGWTEQTAVDHVIAEAARILENAGETVFSEANSKDPNFPGSTRNANEWGADYVISGHFDWVGAPPGAFVHWISSAGKALADDIYDAIEADGWPMRPSWHKRRTDLYILKHTNAPCVLVEFGKIGDDILDEPEELRKMGRALAAGIAQHIGISIDDAPSSPPQGDDGQGDTEKDQNNWTERIVNNLPLVSRDDNSRGAYARRAQGLLVASGHAPDNTIRSDGSLDGIFGPKSEAATESFQRSQGLSVDGIVGPNTWTALLGG